MQLLPSWSRSVAAFLLAACAALPACGGGGGGGGEPESDIPTTASLEFIPPDQSLDLANYTLTGKHDLPQGSGVNLLCAEASAVTYDQDTDTLFIVGDHGTSMVQVSKTGQLIDSMQLPQDATGPQGTFFYDPEGIAYVGGGQLVIAEERYRKIDRLTYAGATVYDQANAQSVKMGTTIGNIGIEGLSFDPFSGGFLFVKEKTPLGVFQSGVNFALGTATNGSDATVDSVNLFDPTTLGVADLGDVYSLSNVLPALAPDYSEMLLLSQESGRILKVTRTGTIRGRLDISLSSQTEGLTLDQNRVLYLANELGGGPGHPQLWVYTPTTSSNAVGIGSNIYVTFDKNVIAGLGNIVFDNGAGDVRTIDVTNAAQVTISGRTVKIDPTADMISGTTYAVSAAAGVLRSASGQPLPAVATLLAAPTFSTVVDDLAPTLESSNPLDNAASVVGSHILLSFSEPVKAGAGQIVLHSSALADDRSIPIGDITQVTIAGNLVDVTPVLDLKPGTTYYVTVTAGAITDISGNAYAGISASTELNFQTAGSAPATPLAAGDVLFMAVNGDAVDAITFVILKAISVGTQICFTDKDYSGASPWPANEAAFTWAADKNYPAGTIVTIQTDSATGSVDRGFLSGIGGGISTTGETYYAFIGTIVDAATGNLVVDHFLAAINSGGIAAGTIPAELVTAGTYITFAADNAKYNASFSQADLVAFATLVKSPGNWSTSDTVVAPILTNGSMFQTPLAPNDLLFLAVNGNDTDAIAFVLSKAVVAGTQVCFTDKDFSSAGTPSWPNNEAAYTWTADVAYPAGTIVTITTATPSADKGSVVGTGGGVSTTAETYYAFVGSIASPSTGDLSVGQFLAAINVSGGVAGDIPAAVTAATTYFTFAEANVKYTGGLAPTDPGFPASVKNPANWTKNATTGFPLVGGSFTFP